MRRLNRLRDPEVLMGLTALFIVVLFAVELVIPENPTARFLTLLILALFGATAWVAFRQRRWIQQQNLQLERKVQARTEELARERNLLRTLIDNVPDFIYVKDTQSKFILGNKAVAALMGAGEPENLIGKTDADFYPADIAAKFRRDEERLLASGVALLGIEEEYRTPDGRSGWLSTIKVPLRDEANRIVGLVGIGRDITENKRRDLALKEREEQYRRIVETADEGILTTNAQDRIVYVNPRAAEIFGYPDQSLIGLSPLDLVFAEDRTWVQQHLVNQRAGIRSHDEYRIRRRDGSEAWVYVSTSPFSDEEGQYAGTLYMVTDITERRRAEEKLRASESLYRSLVEVMPQCVLRKDWAGRITFGNARFFEDVGKPADQVLGKTDFDLFPPQLAEKYWRDDRRVLVEGKMYEGVEEHVRGDGRRIFVRVVKSPLRDEEGNVIGIQTMYWDITEGRRQQELVRKLSRAVEYSPVSIVITNAQGTIEYVNPTFTQVTGYTEEEAIGQNPRILKSGRMPPEIYKELWGTITSGRVWRGEFLNRKRNGELYWEAASISPIINEEGVITHYVGIKEDITERKRTEEALREQQARLASVINNTADVIFSIDRDYRLTFFNETLRNMVRQHLGLEVEAGMSIFDLVPRETVAIHRENFERAFAGERRIYETEFPPANGGDKRYYETYLNPIYGEGHAIVGLAIFTRDITERKIIERMKNEFISTVSHELRTPLTSIRGSLGLIAGGVAGPIPERARHMIDIAYKNSERLIRLINDMLDIEKIESGKMVFHFKPIELMSLIEQAVEANSAYAESYQTRYVITQALPGVEINADWDRMMQVMTNLLSNAAKFSTPGTEVEIQVRHVPYGVRVAVTDHGPGIPEDFRPRIFQKFAQADGSDSRQKGGTGLGLSIVRAIIEKHGGTVGFETALGVGTTFYFDLPIWQERRLPEMAPASPQPRILVCEDDRDVAQLLKMMLAQSGFAADIAHTATQAKEMLKQRNYAVLTLDLLLPDMSGLALIRELRNDPATRALPIVVVSAIAEQGRHELNGEAFWVADWLGKPIDQAQLVRAVTHAAQHFRKGRPHILHVEDDPDVLQIVSVILQDIADVVAAHTLHQARLLLQQHDYDLVILDPMLPDGSGTDLLPLLRQGAAHPIPVVLFSAREEEPHILHQVNAALVKSRTSNEQLLETITAIIQPAMPQEEQCPRVP